MREEKRGGKKKTPNQFNQSQARKSKPVHLEGPLGQAPETTAARGLWTVWLEMEGEVGRTSLGRQVRRVGRGSRGRLHSKVTRRCPGNLLLSTLS